MRTFYSQSIIRLLTDPSGALLSVDTSPHSKRSEGFNPRSCGLVSPPLEVSPGLGEVILAIEQVEVGRCWYGRRISRKSLVYQDPWFRIYESDLAIIDRAEPLFRGFEDAQARDMLRDLGQLREAIYWRIASEALRHQRAWVDCALPPEYYALRQRVQMWERGQRDLSPMVFVSDLPAAQAFTRALRAGLHSSKA